MTCDSPVFRHRCSRKTFRVAVVSDDGGEKKQQAVTPIARAVVNPVEGIYACGVCGNKTDFIMKTIPYAMKLWMQELEAMHITPKMILE